MTRKPRTIRRKRIKFYRRATLGLVLLMIAVFQAQSRVQTSIRKVFAGGTAATGDDTYPGTAAGLTEAINDAVPGDTIYIQNDLDLGSPSTGFVLRQKSCPAQDDSCYITVTGGIDNLGNILPEGNYPPNGMRIDPTYAGLMPNIRPTSNNQPAMRTVWPGETGNGCTVAPCRADYWRIRRIEFTPNSPWLAGAILVLGTGNATTDVTAGNNQNLESEIPHHLIADQIIVRGDPVRGQHRCMTIASKDTFLTNSYIYDCKSLMETQAVWVSNTVGPVNITNNYMEGTGETFFTGGADPYGRFSATVLASPAPTINSARLSNCQEMGTSANKKWFTIEVSGAEKYRMIDTINTTTCDITWTDPLPGVPDQPGDADNVNWSWNLGGLVVEKNYITKQMSWRDPILTQPVLVSALPSISGGGTLAAGSNAYNIVARITVTNNNVAQSAWTEEIPVTTTGTNSANVVLTWEPVTNADNYQIYWRLGNATRLIATVTAPTVTYNHTSPTAGTAINGTPQGASVTGFTTGGTLAAGTYYYRIDSRSPLQAPPTEELVCTIASGTTGRCDFSWTAVTGATGYRIWGRGTTQTLYLCTSGQCGLGYTTASTTFTDPGGTVSGTTHTNADIFHMDTPSVWTVKNTLELKNCDGYSPAGQCTIRWNIIENSWTQAQSGMVVNVKNNNQNFNDDSAVFRRTLFEYNIIRNGTRAIQTCSFDCDGHGSGVSDGIWFRHNLIYNISDFYGTNQSAIYMGSGSFAGAPSQRAGNDYQYDHNTILMDSDHHSPFHFAGQTTSLVWPNLKWTNNLAIKGTWGWHGDWNGSFGSGGEGEVAWALQTSGAGRQAWNNVFADATSTAYDGEFTAGLYPSFATFQAYFTSYAGCLAGTIASCALTGSSAADNAASDGTDIGANIETLLEGTTIAASGNNSGANVAPNVDAGADQTVTFPGAASLSATVNDDGLPNPPSAVTLQWTQTSGPGTATFDAPTSAATGVTFSAAGAYVLRLTANDSLLTAFDEVAVTSTTSTSTPPTYLSKMDANTDNANAFITTNAGTISGTNKYIACALAFNNLSQSGTNIIINDTSETLTFQTAVTHDAGSGSVIRIEFWDKIAPTDSTGTTTLTANTTVGGVGRAIGCGVWTGVHQTTPHGGFTTSNGSAVSSAVTISTDSTDELVVDFVAVRTNTQITETAGQTQRVERIGTNAGNASVGISEKAGAASTTMTWSSDDAAAKTWAHIAIAMNGLATATNTAPTVSAGADQTVTLPAGINVDGTVSDDGLPASPGTTTPTWSKLSGPGTVTFGNSALVDTTATFSTHGNYVLRLSVTDGSLTTTDDMSVVVSPASSFVKVEAEDFRTGGEAVAYHDTTATNQGNANYRPGEGVDIETTTDDGGGYNIGFVKATEWLEYNVTVPITGDYDIEFRTASDGDPGNFHLEVNNVDVTGTVQPTDTGSWQVWQTNTVASVALTAGAHVLRLEMDADGASGNVANMNWFQLVHVPATPNTAPVVDAGADAGVTLPSAATLDGTVTDDGLPDPPAAVSTTWAKVSGPGTVAFGDATLVDTTASFSLQGTYVLRLTGDDSDLSAFDEVTITVSPIPNVAPDANAGADTSTTFPAGVNLDGTVSDDGNPNPPGAVTVLWTQTSGPGTATFVSDTSVDTAVTFSLAGAYVLRLTASDSALTDFDEIGVTVNAPQATGLSLRADRFMLNNGPCNIRSGSGPPATLTGCDVYLDSSSGRLHERATRTESITAPVDLTLDPAGNNVLPSLGYDINLGSWQKKFGGIWGAELNVDTLVAQDVLATIGGRVMVAPTNILSADLDDAATTMVVKYNNLANGDRVYMEGGGQVEFFAVISSASGSAGAYTYTVTRNLDGTGANDWFAGDAVLNTGQSGNGFIDIYSSRGVKASTEVGPTIAMNVRNTSTYNDWSPRAVFGNMTGTYGYTATSCGGIPCYGVSMGIPSGAWLKIDPSNGVRIGYDTLTSLQLDSAGNGSFAGTLTSVAGSIGGMTISNNSLSAGSGTTKVSLGTGGIFLGGDTLTTAPFSVTPEGFFTATAGNISGILNVTGFANNVIKNSTFEGATDAAKLNGWVEDARSSPAGLVTSSCCGVAGPGTLFMGPGTGLYNSASYSAVPVSAGQVYRITAWVFSTAITPGVYIRLHESTNTGYVSRVVNRVAVAPEVVFTSMTDVVASGALAVGWNKFEVTYTVPSAVYWVSLNLINYTAIDGTYTVLHFDGVEMELKIGAGHINAGSINAGHIVANTITANEIAANAITTSELDADSVTSAKIVAGTIVASDIAASTITASQIAAGTITATQIATSTITADRLTVSTLSAISANLGTVTAGTIDGVTIRAGSADEVTLNSSGITLTAGTGGNNKMKWSDGGAIYSSGDTLFLEVEDRVSILAQNDINLDPGRDGSGFVQINGPVPPRLTMFSGSNRFVCHDNEGDLYSSATTCDGSAPSPSPLAMLQRIEQLEAEVSQLMLMLNNTRR